MTELSLPFHDVMLSGDEVIRTFSAEVDESELKWHQDNERRVIQIIEDGGWKIQLENEMPHSFSLGESFDIPRLKWHRVIKGNGNLVVIIKKIKD